MPFPVTPKDNEDPNHFLIRDSFEIRRAIVPLLVMDKEIDLIKGLGTAFRVDPFGTYLTAHHVLECDERKEFLTATQLGKVFAMHWPGIAYGNTPILKECFSHVIRAETFCEEKENPLILFKKQIFNSFDCAKIFLDSNNIKTREHTEFVPLAFNQYPKVGDKVMALGFSNVMGIQDHIEENRCSFTEDLYGAIGEITKIMPTGRDSTKPWPTFEVSSKWPSGMSGGPIFNEQGNVIGIVSNSFNGLAISYSFWFQAIPMFKTWLPFLDPEHPGFIQAWGVISETPENLIGVFTSKEKAVSFQSKLDLASKVEYISHRYDSDDFIIKSPLMLTAH